MMFHKCIILIPCNNLKEEAMVYEEDTVVFKKRGFLASLRKEFNMSQYRV